MSKGKSPKSRRSARNAKLIDKAIQAFEKNIENKNVTVSEFLRLVELEKEEREPKEIKVTWVESEIEEPSSEK